MSAFECTPACSSTACRRAQIRWRHNLIPRDWPGYASCGPVGTTAPFVSSSSGSVGDGGPDQRAPLAWRARVSPARIKRPPWAVKPESKLRKGTPQERVTKARARRQRCDADRNSVRGICRLFKRSLRYCAVAGFGRDSSVIPSPAGCLGGRSADRCDGRATVRAGRRSLPFRDRTAPQSSARACCTVIPTGWSMRCRAVVQAQTPDRRLW
jgi:hypothetical protein